MLFVIACFSCKQQNQQEIPQEQESVKIQQEKDSVKEILLKNFTHEEISKYAIAAIMNQSPSIIKVNKSNDLYFVSYVRKSDFQKFDYKIKFDGNQIIWANVDGQWRDNGVDERIAFVEERNKIKIVQTFSDGSESVDEFKKGQ